MTRGHRAAKLNFDGGIQLFSFVDAGACTDFTCPICLGPMEVPTQAVCLGADEGHRACQLCLQRVVSGNRRCPRCNVPVAMGFRDAALERQMKPIRVKCDLCDWQGLWGDRTGHLEACEEAGRQLGWRCPLENCPFTAETEREVEVHLLAGFQEHLELARPIARLPAQHPTFGCKDTAQVYLPDLAAFHRTGLPIDSPAFSASKGYLCKITLQPGEEESLFVYLKFFPDLSKPGIFPFARPFHVFIVNPDSQSHVAVELVDYHISLETRLIDYNINPPVSGHWTGGIGPNKFVRSRIHDLNRTHLIVKVIVL